MPPIDTKLRQRVAALIRADSRSQVEISRVAGVGVRTVSAIVTGDRADLRADVVARLGRALGLTPTAIGKLLYETCTDPPTESLGVVTDGPVFDPQEN